MLFLFATGKISRTKYLDLTTDKKTKFAKYKDAGIFKIRTHQAFGMISKKTADILVKDKEQREQRLARIEKLEKQVGDRSAQAIEKALKDRTTARDFLAKEAEVQHLKAIESRQQELERQRQKRRFSLSR